MHLFIHWMEYYTAEYIPALRNTWFSLELLSALPPCGSQAFGHKDMVFSFLMRMILMWRKKEAPFQIAIPFSVLHPRILSSCQLVPRESLVHVNPFLFLKTLRKVPHSHDHISYYLIILLPVVLKIYCPFWIKSYWIRTSGCWDEESAS